MKYLYVAYGLSVQSAIRFPSLATYFGNGVDCTIRFGRLDAALNEADVVVSGETFRVTNAGVYRFWDDVGTLLIRNGREIIVDPLPDIDEDVIRSVILGAGFATLLHERGHLVLHASAAAINGKALVFLGASGQGKSTLAVALYNRGHHLITDDVTAIDTTESTPEVIPGYPQVNVMPAALTALALDSTKLRRVEPAFEKRAFPVPERFADDRLPLTRVYVLDEGPESALELLPAREAFRQIVRHSYCAHMLTQAESAAHLSQCAHLVTAATIIRARIRRSLDELPALARLIEDTLKTAEI